jgi:hypothetical protein
LLYLSLLPSSLYIGIQTSRNSLNSKQDCSQAKTIVPFVQLHDSHGLRGGRQNFCSFHISMIHSCSNRPPTAPLVFEFRSRHNFADASSFKSSLVSLSNNMPPYSNLETPDKKVVMPRGLRSSLTPPSFRPNTFRADVPEVNSFDLSSSLYFPEDDDFETTPRLDDDIPRLSLRRKFQLTSSPEHLSTLLFRELSLDFDDKRATHKPAGLSPKKMRRTSLAGAPAMKQDRDLVPKPKCAPSA